MSLSHWPPADEPNSVDTLVARAFGTGAGDFSVDFLAPIDIAISSVLQGCLYKQNGDAFSGADISHWTIAKRRQGLLAISISTNGPRRFITVTCSDLDCGAKMDLEITLSDFRSDWRKDTIEVVLLADRTITVRHPTPSDLALLSSMHNPEKTELAQILLIGETPSESGWEEKVQQALTEADRLADLELTAACPNCGKPTATPLILETFLMGELSKEFTLLMDNIHTLAMAYNWTETDILALPENRRRHYLARIQEAWAA